MPRVLITVYLVLCTNLYAHSRSGQDLYLGQQLILQRLQHLQKTPKYFPLLVESNLRERQVSGTVFALLHYTSDHIKEKLLKVQTWCFVVHLHPNIKACVRDVQAAKLRVFFGSKTSNRSIQSQDFRFHSGPQDRHYYAMALTAKQGPYQTRNYYIVLEAVTLGEKKTMLRLAYGYEYGRQARLMQNLYFGTLGRHKKGFSQFKDKKGRRVPVRGMQAAVERNSLRYFLGLRAFFENGAQEKTYAYWYDLTSRYPQLYELSKEQYLHNKNRERTLQARLRKTFAAQP